MSHLESKSSNASYKYAGNELDVFAHAATWKHYFACQLRPFIKGRVLEVGAGIGGTTRVLAVDRKNDWTCLEPDADLAKRLREAVKEDFSQSSLLPKVVNGSLATFDNDAMFDCILYVDVLEHIEDDTMELERAAEHVSPGGTLVVLSPAHQWLFSPFDAAVGHFRRYSRKSLRDAGPNSLRLVRLRYLDSIGLLASLANRVLLRSDSPNHRQILFWDRIMIPASRVIDPLLGYRLGKTIVSVWRRC